MKSEHGLISEIPNQPKSSVLSLEEVFRRDYSQLVRAAWLLSGSREVAEDVVQDVFAEMLRSVREVDDPGRYIYRSVVNRVRSWQRRQDVERRRAPMQPLVVTPPEMYGLQRFLSALSERQRAAVVLRYYCDLSLAQVADLMGCRTGTVTVLIRRAFGKARKMKEVFDQ
jgi:DNA-directed RNA polymerase specialized sigma24 family protein